MEPLLGRLHQGFAQRKRNSEPAGRESVPPRGYLKFISTCTFEDRSWNHSTFRVTRLVASTLGFRESNLFGVHIRRNFRDTRISEWSPNGRYMPDTNMHFFSSSPFFLQKCYLSASETLKKLKELDPQYELNGMRNIWILKPSELCCGSGISISHNLKDILRRVDGKPKDYFVVQKYIGRCCFYFYWYRYTCKVFPLEESRVALKGLQSRGRLKRLRAAH